MPLALDALERMHPAVFELDPRAEDEVLHGARHEHRSRPGERGDPRADVYGEAGQVVAAPFGLTGVQAGADGDSEIGDPGDDRLRAADRPHGTVERGEEAVAGVRHLAAA